jgi:hypothetical protein
MLPLTFAGFVGRRSGKINMTQSLKEDGRPATLWFWDDWFSSFDVRACSLAARGLWMDMLGIMARSEIIGTLTINGKQIDSTTLAKIAGTSEADIETSLSELEGNRVFSRLPDGTIVNRRMFNGSQRKEMISKIKAAAGKKGAEARWQSDGKAIADPPVENMAKMALPIQTNPNQSKKTKRDGRIPTTEFDPLFDEFWEGYPKKVGKEVAREKFMILARTGKITELIKATNGYMDYLKSQRVHKNFDQEPMNPATFLMKERWRDYIEFKYEPPM